VEKDASEAYGWLLESSRNGNQQASQLVERIRAGLKTPEAPPKP
jgi:hypothetical protein